MSEYPATTHGAMMTDDTIDAVSKALRHAWQLGQTYWQQADSDSWKQQGKAGGTQKKFEALVDETRALLYASKPAVPQPVMVYPQGVMGIPPYSPPGSGSMTVEPGISWNATAPAQAQVPNGTTVKAIGESRSMLGAKSGQIMWVLLCQNIKDKEVWVQGVYLTAQEASTAAKGENSKEGVYAWAEEVTFA